MQSTVIQYVSAPCGSGKTHAFCQWVQWVQEMHTLMRPNILYAAPTIALIGEVSATLKGQGIKHQVFTSETNPDTVIRDLVSSLKDADQNGEIILTTHRAFEFLPYFHRRR